MRKRSLDFIAILYIIIWTISPPLQIGMVYRLVALGCAGLLFLNNKFKMTKQHGYALLFCVLVAISVVIESGKFSSVLGQIGIYMLFIGYVMNYWYEYDWNDFKLIVPVVLLLLAFWNFKTVSVIATNPNAARAIVRNDELANGFLRQGVGGYALMYCQVIIIPAIVKWILTAFNHSKIFFVCGIIWAVSFLSFLDEAGYSIAVVASFVSVIVLLVYKRRNVVPALIFSLIVLAIIVYLIGYNEAFRNMLLNVFDGTKVAKKIADITSTVTTDETADSIAVRIARYNVSIRAVFIDYPLIGGWWKGGAGGHSFLLDAFGQYGLFGGIMMCRMVYCVPTIWKRYECNAGIMSVVNATIISISFVAWLDSVPYNLTMMLMVVLPIILSNIEMWSKENEHIMDSQFNSN